MAQTFQQDVINRALNNRPQNLREGPKFGTFDWKMSNVAAKPIVNASFDPLPETIAEFTANTNAPIGYTPLTISFQDLSQNATSWAWDLDGDGDVDSTEQNPTFTYQPTEDAFNLYTVSLTTTNNTSVSINTKINAITAVSLPFVYGSRWYSQNTNIPQKPTFTSRQFVANDSVVLGVVADGVVAAAPNNWVVRSSDGLNWSLVQLPNSGRQLDVINSQNSHFVVRVGQGKDNDSNDNQVYRSIDNGLTWQLNSLPVTLPTNWRFVGAAASSERAILLGQPSSQTQPGSAFITINGGASWLVSRVPDIVDTQLIFNEKDFIYAPGVSGGAFLYLEKSSSSTIGGQVWGTADGVNWVLVGDLPRYHNIDPHKIAAVEGTIAVNYLGGSSVSAIAVKGNSTPSFEFLPLPDAAVWRNLVATQNSFFIPSSNGLSGIYISEYTPQWAYTSYSTTAISDQIDYLDEMFVYNNTLFSYASGRAVRYSDANSIPGDEELPPPLILDGPGGLFWD